MTHEKLMTAEERVRAMERRMGPCHDDERPTIIATMEAHAAAAVEAFRASVAEVLDAGREIRSGIRASMLEMIEDSERDRAKLTQELDAALAQLASVEVDLTRFADCNASQVARIHTLKDRAEQAEAQIADFREYADAERALRQSQDAVLAERTRERNDLRLGIEVWQRAMQSEQARAEKAEAEVARLRELLAHVQRYGNAPDTDSPDDHEDAVVPRGWFWRRDAALAPAPGAAAERGQA